MFGIALTECAVSALCLSLSKSPSVFGKNKSKFCRRSSQGRAQTGNFGNGNPLLRCLACDQEVRILVALGLR